MSTDEIVFGDVSYREPKRLRRPDLDRKWACIAYELPQPGQLPIFLDYETADAIERHALSDTSVELGGILLGHECIDEETGQAFVWITKWLEARHYENTQASFTYTHDSWEEITRERDKRHPELDIVGWYHTHPDFGIFLSSHDQFLHRHFFGQPLQVAYVIDPIRQTRGFFQWRDAALEEVGGYFIMADRAQRLAVARFVNDLEQIPNLGGGPGGLSPRLEAELIAMLSRPAYAPAAPERGQLAALFMLIGVALGALGFSAALWLNSLFGQIQEQSKALKDLRATVVKAEATHAGGIDAARLDAKAAALDYLLREVKSGAPPEQFATLYADSQRQLDEARDELKQEKVKSNAVYQVNQRIEADLKDARRNVEALKKDAQQVKTLEEQVRVLEAEAHDRDRDSAIHRRYQYAWYAAVGGWGLSLALGIALSSLYARPQSGENLKEEERPHAIT